MSSSKESSGDRSVQEPVAVRNAKLPDINALVRLYKSERAVSDFAGLHNKARFIHLIKSKDNLLIVATRGDKVLAALDAEFYDESKFSYFANLVVAKSARRRGIASRLIGEYERTCRLRKIKIVLSLVYGWNQGMRKLMRKERYKNQGMLVEYLKRLD